MILFRFIFIFFLILLLVGFVVRHLGSFMLRRWMRHVERQMNPQQQQKKAKKQAAQNTAKAKEPVIPKGVGEYVDYEEVS